MNIYLTSPVFFEIAQHSKVSDQFKEEILNLKNELTKLGNVIVSDERFPKPEKITKIVKENNVDIIICHLSHPISKETLNIDSVKACITSTAGFNHIDVESNKDIIYCHTPGVLDKTVGDFTIALILSNLRNIVNLHNIVWEEKWKAGQKWDLDENLNNVMDNKKLGIVGLGEIGREVIKRLAPWGIEIEYFDLIRSTELEEKYPNLQYRETMEEIFTTSDILSLHIPLNQHTQGIINKELLLKMKKGALLINTARGGIINFEDLLDSLESGTVSIDFSFDVWEPEPISTSVLNRLKRIQSDFPERRFICMPHNASSDADTRAQMSIMVLKDCIDLVNSKNVEDIKSIHLIPKQRDIKNLDNLNSLRIQQNWI